MSRASDDRRTVLGDFLLVVGAEVEPSRVLEALARYPWPLGREAPRTFRRVGPGLSLLYGGDVLVSEGEGAGGVGLYQLVPPEGEASVSAEAFHTGIVQAWQEGRPPLPRGAAGRFCYATWDRTTRRIAACTDAFRTLSLYYAWAPGWVACATDLRLLLASGLIAPEVDPHAVYHYLNFCYVPTPFSILKGVSKVPPGCVLEGSAEGASIAAYWDPRYPEDLAGDDDRLAHDLRERIVDTVHRYRPDSSGRWGTFLSGGTDSSSIAGILSRGAQEGSRVATFSIGFEEEGYDELRYVRIAASHFRLDSRQKTVGASEALAIVPRLLEGFDEPFGNSSAIPTHLCAAFARENGIGLLLAGDGGDEIFGGNERYRKDRILGWYHRAPRFLRAMAATAVGSLDGVDVQLVNRVRNFVRRGSLPNPDRFYTDDSFASDHFSSLLTGDFQAEVDVGESLELLRETYAAAATESELHRLMYLDLERTIADSDIVKVGRASMMAGVSVAYPYLDPALVDYTGRLPSRYKVKGLEKRYLFKKALRDVLPQEIREKKKQGFGLPMAVWLRTEPQLSQLVRDIVLSQRARARGYFDPGYVEALIDRHQKGAWDHSTEIFRLLMLELWHRAYVDG